MIKGKYFVVLMLSATVLSGPARASDDLAPGLEPAYKTQTGWLIAPKRDKKTRPPKPIPQIPIMPNIPPK